MRSQFLISLLISAALLLPAILGVSGQMQPHVQAVGACEQTSHCHLEAQAQAESVPCAAHCLISGRQAVLTQTTFFNLILLAAGLMLVLAFAPTLVLQPGLAANRPIPKRLYEILSVRKRE